MREFETKLADWLARGYQVLADDVDGELRLTAHYVAREGEAGHERELEFWPMSSEIAKLLADNGIIISRRMAGPEPWPGPHPEPENARDTG